MEYNNDARDAKTVEQTLKEPPGRLRISLWLNKDIQNIPFRINRPPQPEFLASDHDHNLVQVPFVGGRRPALFDAIREMRPKPVHPFANGFSADAHTALSQ